jgi:hypothetical protein
MSERWIEFQGGPARGRRDEPRVTLNNRGVVHLNRHAFEALGSPAAVKLSYEEDRRFIGVAPQDPQKRNAFPVMQKDKHSNRTIHTSSFCKHWNISVGRTVVFEEIDIDREGMMRLDLNRTIKIGKDLAKR